MPVEIWKPIIEADGYEVSNLGRVRSLKRKSAHIMNQLFFHGWSYLSVMLITGSGSKRDYFAVHRLVAKAFIPNPDNKPVVNHINGIKTDNRVENLEWCTQSENMCHAVRIGVIKTGEDSPASKLTNEQVVYIRDNPDNLTAVELGKKFGVVPDTIYLVQTGKIFRDVGGKIRNSRKYIPPVPAETREEIRRLYVKGSKEFNCYSLGRKFGLSPAAVCKIVKDS